MVRKLSERQVAVVFVIALGLVLAGLFAYAESFQVEPAVARASVTASLVIEGGAWVIRYGPVETTNNTAFALLLEASRHLGFPVQELTYTLPSGVFVTSINGTANGQGGQYWQYWVNGVYGTVAADHASLASGDVVTWRFTTDQGGSAG